MCKPEYLQDILSWIKMNKIKMNKRLNKSGARGQEIKISPLPALVRVTSYYTKSEGNWIFDTHEETEIWKGTWQRTREDGFHNFLEASDVAERLKAKSTEG